MIFSRNTKKQTSIYKTTQKVINNLQNKISRSITKMQLQKYIYQYHNVTEKFTKPTQSLLTTYFNNNSYNTNENKNRR